MYRALSLGLSEAEFWRATPRQINLLSKCRIEALGLSREKQKPQRLSYIPR